MKKLQFLFAFICVSALVSCSEDDASTPPVLTVQTATPSNLTNSSVTLGGEVVSDAGKPVTERGICIGETANPVINDPNGFTDVLGSGLGIFSDTYDISSLSPNTIVHVRAYAINADGIVYGENKTFVTLGCATVTIPTTVISTPITFSNGNVYILDGTLTVNAVLTIEPGVILKLTNNGNIDVQGSGKIIANGTLENRIVFTSIADDSYCGDTNGDGSTTLPQKGDWQNVYLNGGTGNSFRYCDFLYAGANDGGYRCAVLISVAGPSFTFDNCTFAHTQTSTNFTAQFAFYGGSYMSNPAVSVFTNNVFYDNNIPIYLSATYSIDPNNSYSNPLNPSQKNTRNCIWMYPDAGTNIAVSVTETEVPYVMDGYLQKSTGSMTIGPGAIMKFPTGNTFGLNIATLNLHPTAFLTSLKDDVHGGDTNGDGNVTAPANGDWYGYYNWTTSAWVNGTNILYAAN
jgi:hypothetical protein